MKPLRVAVLGLGEFGESLAVELARQGCEVIAVDRDSGIVERLKDRVARAAAADVRQAEAMRELFTTRPDVGVIAMGDRLEASILAVLHLQELEVPRIVVEVTNADNEEVMRRLGATEIVSPERDSGTRMAHRILNPDLVEHLRLARGHSIIEVEAPAWTRGKTVGEVCAGKQRRLLIVALLPGNDRKEIAVAPPHDEVIRAGDRLTLIGRDKDLAEFQGGDA
jgi:trk system potassium uptake protein TrkA